MYSTAAPVFVRLKGGACNLFSWLTGERPSTLPSYFDFPLQVHVKPIKDKSTIFPNAVRIASQASQEASISGLNIKTHINPILTCTNGRRKLLKQQFCSSSCDTFLSEEPQTEKPPLIKRKKNKLLSHTRRKLIYGNHRAKGRNARGVMTAWWHRGGGHKRLYRKIDFRRNKTDVCGRIKTIEYDPNRSANICLVQYKDGEKGYIIHPRGARVGDTIVSAGNAIPS